MDGILVRVGVDQAFGDWNAPVDPATNDYVYVPIPESKTQKFKNGLSRSFQEAIPALHNFCTSHNLKIDDIGFPEELLERYMHLDPDFSSLTYGDVGSRRGKGISALKNGDVLVFYAGLRPIKKYKDKLLYALVGVLVIEDIVQAQYVPLERHGENAHTRRLDPNRSDIIVRGKKQVSGRFEHCIPIGEWRNGAYRVDNGILNEWGGLSVKDGFIQRSAVPPSLLDADKFDSWLDRKNTTLVQKNF